MKKGSVKKLNNQYKINIDNNPPNFIKRILNVWYRHFKVYSKNLISNGIEVILEPMFFLIAIGLGLGKYIVSMEGIPYINFLASAIIVPASMYTAAFECSFGTFIRLEFDKVYDGMLSAPITAKDLLIGEIFFAGTKGFFFSCCILLVLSLFGLVTLPIALLAPIGGFLTGLIFATFSLLITSFVNTINHFNFYFSGLLTPMFFFSGIIFPLSNIPVQIRWLAYVLPLSHTTKIVRAFCLNEFSFNLFFDLIYIILFIFIIGFLAIIKLEKRLIN
jgi:lipooligosaccharide transport system permease protein